MDKLLNLIAAINDDNWDYNADFMVIREEGFDFYVNCKKYMYGEDVRTSFSYDKVLPVLNDFERYAINSYVKDEGPMSVPKDEDDFVRHEVEIKVKI